jgi:glycopeptide antibiotics resistance protein
VIADFLQRLALLALFVLPAGAYLAVFARMAADETPPAKSRSSLRFVVFAIYVMVVATLTLAPPPISPSNGIAGINLLPIVRSLRCFVPDPGQPPTAHFCIRIISGNVSLFIPMGFLIPLVSPRHDSLKAVVAVAAFTSIGIEILQAFGSLLGSARWSDIDDVILNVLGAIIGYAVYRGIALAARLVGEAS